MADTQSTASTQDVLADRRDDGGNLIDPPTIPEYEQQMTAAANAGDVVLLEEIQGDYDKAREKLARAEVARDKKRAKLRGDVQ